MRHLVFDLESTGLIANSLQPLHKQPIALEFFGLVLDNEYKEHSSLHQLFNPGKPISPTITKITGIDDAKVADAPKFADACSDIEKLIASVDVVVAHNLSYDMSVVDFEFQRIGKKVKWPSRRICTVEATEALKGYRLSLGALYQELFNEEFKDAHRAENDVRALARCYIELVKRGEV